VGSRARIALVGLALVVVLAGAGVAAASQPVAPTARLTQAPVDASKTPVVFISMDEFSLAALESAPGVIDARRYPNFAALAQQSTWFPNTTPSADGTRWAQPALMAGVRPNKDRIPIASDYPQSIFTLLGGTHRFFVDEPLTRLCPASLCRGHTVPGRTRKQKADALNALIRQEKLRAAKTSELADFIARIEPWRSGKPPFYFLHVLMPHHPWVWLPSGKRYPSPVPEMPGLHGDNLWRDNAALVNRAWQRYLLQVGYTDRLIGQLMARMKQAGLWESALVVISPDHGVSFLPGESRRTATETTVGGIGVIPFFMKRPGQTLGTRVNDHVQTIDVLPTAADALDLPAPADIDGHSALDPRFKPSPVAELWSTTSVGKSFGRRTYPMSLVRRRFAALIAQQAALFGTGPLGARFFDLGPSASLVGRAASALPAGSQKVKVKLNGKPTGSPAVVTGNVKGVAPKKVVAVVIGGKVAATAQTYRYTSAVRFETAVPRGGPVSVYAVG
jgi:hypothetical protein